MPFSLKADEFAWTQEDVSPARKPEPQPSEPVDHADEFENITAWWWNPEAASRGASRPQADESGEAHAAQTPEAATVDQPRPAGRWAGQALGVYRRLVGRTIREILSAQNLAENFATDEALSQIYLALEPQKRAEFNWEVAELVKMRLEALQVWLPQFTPAPEENADEGHEHQKRLVFSGPERRGLGEEFVPPDKQYDRLCLIDFVAPQPKTRAERFFLKNYNELFQAAYEKTLREFGLDPFGMGSTGLERRQEVTDEEVNIYEVCRATYDKMDATPMVAALALALGRLLI
ncbi:MAG: hypothetical protein LBV79_08135 [Candidatus Adiutrix sp.]|jgi:hypothetical protein|nr:hypothetical protein [Candidatus Adiutrix sp.]